MTCFKGWGLGDPLFRYACVLISNIFDCCPTYFLNDGTIRILMISVFKELIQIQWCSEVRNTNPVTSSDKSYRSTLFPPFIVMKKTIEI